jgi:hypothetical protein
LDGRFTYLVQVYCQPSPIGCEGQILRTLRRDYAVRSCQATAGTLGIELQSSHRLAQGVFKDLADSVIQILTDLDSRVSYGVIYQTGDGPAEGFLRLFSDGPCKRVLDWALGKSRPAPVFYFYRDVYLDLALDNKVRQMQRQPMEPMVGLN